MNGLSRVLLAFLTWTVLALVLLSGWGWDQIHSFADQRARTLLLPAWLVLSVYGACRNTRTSASGGKKEIRSHRHVIWIMVPLMAVWFVYLPYADRHSLGTSSNDAVRWGGLVLFAASLLFRIEAIRAQGKQFSLAVAVQEGHKLATHGPYRLVRHPAYTGVIGMVLGLSLVFASVRVGLIMTLVTWFWLRARMRDEEKLLMEEFGEEYAVYRKKTPTFVPFIY
jgi:protein-S-isoprenylcysteine O-methyltransferase Ste14